MSQQLNKVKRKDREFGFGIFILTRPSSQDTCSDRAFCYVVRVNYIWMSQQLNKVKMNVREFGFGIFILNMANNTCK